MWAYMLAGAAVAIPAHNDRQDDFILQLEGHKRWACNGSSTDVGSDIAIFVPMSEPIPMLEPTSVEQLYRCWLHRSNSSTDVGSDIAIFVPMSEPIPCFSPHLRSPARGTIEAWCVLQRVVE